MFFYYRAEIGVCGQIKGKLRLCGLCDRIPIGNPAAEVESFDISRTEQRDTRFSEPSCTTPWTGTLLAEFLTILTPPIRMRFRYDFPLLSTAWLKHVWAWLNMDDKSDLNTCSFSFHCNRSRASGLTRTAVRKSKGMRITANPGKEHGPNASFHRDDSTRFYPLMPNFN